MITLLDTCTPSLIFLTLAITTIGVYSIKFYTEPVDPYCRRKNSPEDCGEKRRGFPMLIIIWILFSLLWMWILNIVCYSFSSIYGWLLLCIPFILVIMLSVMYQIPAYRLPFFPEKLGFV